MTLRSRFLLHYSLVIAGLLAIGLYTEHQLDTINGKKRALREEWEELDQALELGILFHSAIWAIEAHDEEQAAEAIASVRAAIADLAEYQEEQGSDLAESFREPEVAVLSRLIAHVDELNRMTGGSPELEHIREVQQRIETTLGDFHAIAEEEMVEAITQIADTEALLDKLMWTWLAALVAALLTGALTLWGRVTKPLRALRAGAAALRRRDFKHRVALRRGDEIGEVAEAFNLMSGELEDLYTSLEEKVAAQAEEIQRSMTELERSMRLATIGTLAAGVAHEINNPLEAISLRTGGMRRRAESEDMRQGLDQVNTEVERCREITRRLLDFARQRQETDVKDSVEDVDVNELVRDAAGLLSLRCEGRAAVRMDLPSMSPTVRGNKTSIRQVILNLLMNAADATQTGGKITVSVSAPEGQAVIGVTDTGEGIDSADLPHIFDPFYTTKAARGTGLGLSVSHGIVLNHGGTLEIHSEGPGRGATARVTLPVDGGDSQ